MATLIDTDLDARSRRASAQPVESPSKKIRREVSYESGRALEILGHAIEYLADELVHEGRSAAEESGRLEAIQLLMSLNRQIYYACPPAPGFGERIRRAVQRFFGKSV